MCRASGFVGGWSTKIAATGCWMCSASLLLTSHARAGETRGIFGYGEAASERSLLSCGLSWKIHLLEQVQPGFAWSNQVDVSITIDIHSDDLNAATRF